MWRRAKEEADAPSPRRRRNYGLFSVPTSCEIVRARVYCSFASYSDANLMHIIKPSTDCIEQACPPATLCKGCQYQHITIKWQRNMKTVQVQELFEQFGGLPSTDFPPVLDMNRMIEVFGYRSKITPHYNVPMQKKVPKRAWGNCNAITLSNIACEIGPIGFKEKASLRLVDVPYCHIAMPEIIDALRRTREEKQEEARWGLLKKPGNGATLLLRDTNGPVEMNHTVYVNATVKGLVFMFQAGNFF
jgi:tRNA (uracil-5-)-methyltransferase